MERFVLFILVVFSFMVVSFSGESFAGAEDTSEAGALFSSKCAGCHGAEGAGTGMLAPIKGSEFLKTATDEDIKKIILEGTTVGMIPMPGMKDKLTKEEVEAIVKYIKNLK